MNVQKLFGAKLGRRRLLGNLGMMGAGAVITACGGAVAQPENPEEPSPNYDAAILNFALNLEYLEAAFYLAAVGRIGEINSVGGDAEIQLPEGFDGTSAIEGLSDSVLAYGNEIANEELAHVNFLRSALGDAAATRPVLNLNTSFQAAATAALEPIPEADRPFAGEDFNPYANEVFFLHGSFIFEDVGVTAYKGAARYLTSKDTLEAAAGILAAEAYHSGEIRTLLYAADKADTYELGTGTIETIVQAISNARNALDGMGDQDQGIANVDIATGGAANISVTDAMGIAYSRTPLQVAKIVYLSADAMVTANSFFPEGIRIPEAQADQFAALLDPTFPNNL